MTERLDRIEAILASQAERHNEAMARLDRTE